MLDPGKGFALRVCDRRAAAAERQEDVWGSGNKLGARRSPPRLSRSTELGGGADGRWARRGQVRVVFNGRCGGRPGMAMRIRVDDHELSHQIGDEGGRARATVAISIIAPPQRGQMSRCRPVSSA